MWQENWELYDSDFSPAGGRGSIKLVKNKVKGTIGVLKRLSLTDSGDKRRRARFNREVTALKAAEGPGIPKVIEHNTEKWEANIDLYVILEFIEGKTISQHVGGQPKTFDEAISITLKIAEILQRVHSQEVRHRDIKPDNIIITPTAGPYLIDFGLAWTAPNQNGEVEDFSTDAGEELGNRFLRLPEFSTSIEKRDVRSDITQLAGVLLYIISGASPRMLINSRGESPHESLLDKIPIETKADPRWLKLQRVFRVAFQNEMDLRYQTIEEFIDAIKGACSETPASENIFDRAEKIKESLRDELSASHRKKKDKILDHLKSAHGAFLASLSGEIRQCNLIYGGSGPNQYNSEERVISQMSVLRPGTQEPQVQFIHYTEARNGKVFATWRVEHLKNEENYYVGPIADPETLYERAAQAGIECATFCMEEYLKRLRA